MFDWHGRAAGSSHFSARSVCPPTAPIRIASVLTHASLSQKRATLSLSSLESERMWDQRTWRPSWWPCFSCERMRSGSLLSPITPPPRSWCSHDYIRLIVVCFESRGTGKIISSLSCSVIPPGNSSGGISSPSHTRRHYLLRGDDYRAPGLNSPRPREGWGKRHDLMLS